MNIPVVLNGIRESQFHLFRHASFLEPDHHRKPNCKRTRECSGYLWGGE
jgi:hypothetical protein